MDKITLEYLISLIEEYKPEETMIKINFLNN